MIKIKNISSARVTIALPSIRLHREIAPGAAMPFKEDEYEYLTFDPGFNTLIDGHYIKVLDAPTVEGETVSSGNDNAYEASVIKDILEKRDITAFAKLIKNASQAERDTIKKYAVELRVTDAAFATLIEKYCGINVLEAISNYAQTIGAEA